jgi:hypothetical protein
MVVSRVVVPQDDELPPGVQWGVYHCRCPFCGLLVIVVATTDHPPGIVLCRECEAARIGSPGSQLPAIQA